MSDQPTDALLNAIKGYSSAFSADKRFQGVLGRLDAARTEAERLDPIADVDEARAGHSRGETRRGHGDQRRDTERKAGPDRNIEERGDPPGGAKRGAPDAEDRIDAERERHLRDEGEKPRRGAKTTDPPFSSAKPLRDAAQQATEVLRTQRSRRGQRSEADQRAEQASDGRK